MMPRHSHPLVHPDPAPVVAPPPAPAPAPGAQAQGPTPLQMQGPALTPAAAPAPAQGNRNAGLNAPHGVMTRDFLGAPGTWIGLVLRPAQACLAAAAVGAMASTDNYTSVIGFRYFVPAAALQCIWSLAMATVDVYALLVRRSFRIPQTVGILSVGDWITGALTLIAASVAAGITTLINDDLEFCYEHRCPSIMSNTAMAFQSWFALATCYVLNLGQLVYKLQRP